MSLTLRPATPDAIRGFAMALPRADDAYANPGLFADAVGKARVAEVLHDDDAPVAILGISRANHAWMHSVPIFRCPFAAFRLMRRRFREWADEFGDVVCAIGTGSKRAVRVMSLIERPAIHDGVARFELKGANHVL